MGDQFAGFEPRIPAGFAMPPGYDLDGVIGENFDGRQVTFYHWTQHLNREWRFGPDEKDKRKAIRQAWRDHRSGGTDPTAVDGPIAHAQPAATPDKP